MMKIVIDEIHYHVEVCGNGRPLMLLHGFTGASTTWSELAKYLNSDYMCVMPDMIGHGKTSSPLNGDHYEITTVASHLIKILDELQVKKVDLLGYSMGGRVALAFAVNYPERVGKLILESASPGLETEEQRKERRKNDQQLATSILKNGVRAFVDYWERIPLFASQLLLPAEKKEQLRKQRLNNSAHGLANSLLYMGTGSQPSYWQQLVNLRMEVLFLAGSLDRKFCTIAEKMQKMTPFSKKMIVSNCGHAIHVEDCEKFGTIVSEFLSKKNDKGMNNNDS